MSAHQYTHADLLAQDDPSTRSLSVVVAADDEVRGRRLLLALARGGLGEGSRPSDLARLLSAPADMRPDVVVVVRDVVRPDALDALAHLRMLPEASPLLVVPSASAADVRAAVAHGAAGVVLEGAVDASLAPTVLAVAAGQLVVPRTRSSQLASQALTTREKQVLGLVVMGFSNAESARRLHVAETTVKSHLRSSFKKLEVRNRSEACARILDPQTGYGLGILSISGAPAPE